MNFWQKLERPFFVLAPMENVTDYPFREIVATILPSPQVFFTEFTSSDALNSPGRIDALQKLKYSNNQRPIVAQIWGAKPALMEKAAKLVQELGFDGVDINMGCPDKSVMKGGCGAAHIKNPKLAADIISAVKLGADKIPVSVKTRIGFDKVVTEEWIGFLLEQKLAALTIHGRTARQMSEGLADWDEIKHGVDLKNSISPDTILIGNGDVKSYEQGVLYSEKYGVDGIMIGRGIFANPWVFQPSQRLPPQSSSRHSSEGGNPSDDSEESMTKEYIDVLRAHMNLFTEFYGADKHFDIMKKFFKMYINNFYGASDIRVKLMECKNKKEVENILKNILIRPNDIG